MFYHAFAILYIIIIQMEQCIYLYSKWLKRFHAASSQLNNQCSFDIYLTLFKKDRTNSDSQLYKRTWATLTGDSNTHWAEDSTLDTWSMISAHYTRWWWRSLLSSHLIINNWSLFWIRGNSVSMWHKRWQMHCDIKLKPESLLRSSALLLQHKRSSSWQLMIYCPFSSFYLIILTNSDDFPGSNYA